MAVIKIVPMPGLSVQGPKGDTGATGPQGPAGPAGESGGFPYRDGNVPSTHHGVPGDLKNDIRYDENHIYVCIADYTDGISAIWKRINWASGNWWVNP